MLEIIKRGVSPGAKQYEGRCQPCGTTVRFLRDDARFVADQRDGDALIVKCPVCGEDIWTAA